MVNSRTPDLSRRGFLYSAGGVGAAALLAACGTASNASKGNGGAASTSPAAAKSKSHRKLTSVTFDYPFTMLPVYAAVSRFAKERAGQVGVNLDLTNDNASLDTQVSNLATVIAKKAPAIVCFPVEPTTVEKQAAAARAAGAIWVTYGGDMTNQDASITFSFLKGGQLLGAEAARWAHQVLGGKGKIAFLIDNTIELGRLRSKGMIDAFTHAAPGVEVVAKQEAFTPDQALTATNAILSKNPDVNIVLAVTDDAGTGAYQALTQRGRSKTDAKTFVGGQDGGKASLALIQQGTFYRASAALAVSDIGRAVIDVPMAVADGAAHPSADVPITLVRKGSAEISKLLAQYG